MIEVLALLVAAAVPPPPERVRPPEVYANCLRLNVTNVADGAPESEWQAGWRQSLARCRVNRTAWWRYHFLGNPSQRDRSNFVEWLMMQIEAEAYQRYRSPVRLESVQHVTAMTVSEN